MEIFVYKSFNDWYKDKATEVLEGTVNMLDNGFLTVDTEIEGVEYRQTLSTKNNFAIIFKYPYGFMPYNKEINIYSDIDAWKKSKPDISFRGQVCEDECSEGRFVFINEDGFKHYLSIDGIYAATYER